MVSLSVGIGTVMDVSEFYQSHNQNNLWQVKKGLKS